MRDRIVVLRGIFALSITVFAGLFVAACTPPPGHEAFFDKPASVAPFTLKPGDQINLKFYYTPEMNDSQTIRPDGKISLQLLGDVDVAGKTPEQLRQELTNAYSGHLKSPDVAVVVRGMNERRVYVGGEVNRPGAIILPGSMTVLEAIMDAGGFNALTARPENVVVLRRMGDKWQGKIVDLSHIVEGSAVSLYELEPRDVVYVPRSAIAKVDQWVDQHINKLIPDIINNAGGSLIGAEIYRGILDNTK
jgi:protein involved in polysaccharide export with SLBB domain